MNGNSVIICENEFSLYLHGVYLNAALHTFIYVDIKDIEFLKERGIGIIINLLLNFIILLIM